MKTQILIIEDEAIIAADIEAILTDLGYNIAKICHSSDQAIDYLSFNTPDLVLCDIQIKGSKDGIEVARIVGQHKKIPFVFLTSFADKLTLSRAVQVTPYGYIVKPFNQNDLLSTIEVALFKFYQEVEMLSVTIDKVNKLTNEHLTQKEYEVLELLINGKSYEEICSDLNISVNTLKYHTRNILRKFDVSNRGAIMQKLLQYLTKRA